MLLCITMTIVFIIYTTVPPSPRNVMVETSLSISLTVVWDSPHPPHGVITGYTLKYSLMGHGGSRSSQNSIDLEPTIQRYNITDLEPNSTYAIQVQVASDIAIYLKYTKCGSDISHSGNW